MCENLSEKIDGFVVMDKRKEFFRGLLFGLILLSLFFSNPAFAYCSECSTQSLFLEEEVEEDDSDNLNIPDTSSVPDSSGFNCGIIELTDEEAQEIVSLAGEGFEGKEISDGSDTNDLSRDLEGVELVGKDNDGETAVKQAPPTKATHASKYSFLTKETILGPFGLGVVLDDTIRVGRCDGLTQEQCRIYGNGLNYRTSGKGISTMFSDASGTFSDFSKQKVSGLTEEEYTEMQNQVYDKNDFEIKTVSVNESEKIPNSFQTNQYTARNATTCNNNACMVSTYSSFDKLFNAWFSTEMVVSTFGPTLLHSAAKRLGLFRLGPSGGAQNKVVQKLDSWIKKSRDTFQEIPSKLIGRKRIDRYQALVKEHGLGGIFTDFTVNSKSFSSGAKGYVDELLEAGGKLDKLSPKQKEAFFSALQDYRSYSEASAKTMSDLKDAWKVSAKTTDDLLDFGKKVSQQVLDWDDATFLDFPAWIKSNPDMSGLQGYAMKKVGFSGADGFVDVTTSDTFNFTKSMVKPFAEKGGWDDFASASLRADEFAVELGSSRATGRGIQLYKLSPSKVVKNNVNVADLDDYINRVGEGVYSVSIPGRNPMPLNASTVNFIKDSPSISGSVDIMESVYTPAKEFFPEDFAAMITQERIISRPKTAGINANDLEIALRQRPDFVSRKSFNALDSAFAKEKDLLKDYYTLKANSAAFYKVALGPIGLWQVKRAAGNEDFSAFMLPDTWTTMTISQGTDPVYADSYIDFYANEGSDQGDLFAKVMNSFIFVPNFIVKEAAETFSPQIGDKLSYISGEGGLGKKAVMRDETKDIAYYSHNENCSGCSLSVSSLGNYLQFSLDAPVNIKSFIVEAVDQETAREEGAALIAYTHHSNLSGTTGDIDGDEINLVEARKDGETCEQKLRELNLGWAGDLSGLVLAGSESLAYAINLGFGLLMTGVQQTLITPKLQDCVDDKEGYYLHFYSPPLEQEQQSKAKEALSNETVTNALSDLGKSVDGLASQDNPIAESMETIKNEFQEFSNQAKNSDVLQATIEMLPPSSGTIIGDEIFYVWFKDRTIPNGLKTEGKEIISDGNRKVEQNYSNGDILVDGKKIVSDKKEIVGLTTQDNRVPAKVIPRRVNTVSKPNINETVFEVNTLGEVLVREKQVLACVQDAVKEQSGIDFSGTELTQVFGELKNVNTKNYGNVFVRDRKIQLEGSGPRMYGEGGAKFIIDGYWQTRLVIDGNNGVEGGEFIGMAFEHGSIVLNEETGEVIVWLRQHKESVLNSKEVSGMNAKLTTTTDPLTDCEQPAIELEAEAYPNDSLGQKRVENFNTSMKKVGPFTQFTTDGKIYEFYSERDETGECKDYFRVIDKETGEVLTDSEIVGGITQTSDGEIKFRTTDGKSHTLEFDADNGVPKVSYNNGPSETLRTAQGKNGSFWFDPDTGQWYPENGMQIPLNQAFKDRGAYYSTDENGNVKGEAGNPMNFNISQDAGSGFNIPSVPETLRSLSLFIFAFLIIAFISTQRITNTKQKKKK
jgi:hypothetical protein